MPGPAVPERVHRPAGDIGRAGDVHAGAVGQADSVAGGAGAGHGEVPRGGEGDGGTGSRFRSISSTTKNGRTMSPTISGGSAAVRDGIVFIGVAQEKAQAFQGKKVNGQFQFTATRRSTSTTTTSTLTMRTSDRCSSRCAAMRRGAQAVPERARMGQAATGEAGDRLRGAGQRLPVLRRAGEVAADLRFAGAGGDRSGVPEMAEADSAAVAAGGSGRPATTGICRSGRWK